MNRVSLVLLAAVTALPLVASADDAHEAHLATDLLLRYVYSLRDLKHDPMIGASDTLTIAFCDETIASARAAGVKDDARLTGEVTFGQMADVCKDYAKWYRIAQAATVLKEADGWNYWLTQIDIAENHEENQEKMVDAAARCTSELDRLVAEGVATDMKLELQQAGELPIGDGKEKVCAPLAKVARTFAKQVTKAREERLAAIAAPYKKAGITSDRLKVCIDWDGIVLRTTGGRELSSPKDLKKASVMFATLGPASDTGLYTIRRFAFHGDKLTAVTEQEFILKPGAAGYR